MVTIGKYIRSSEYPNGKLRVEKIEGDYIHCTAENQGLLTEVKIKSNSIVYVEDEGLLNG